MRLDYASIWKESKERKTKGDFLYEYTDHKTVKNKGYGLH